jgi:hypothetical protein
MTIYQTTLGREHYAQRLDGTVVLDNDFDAIELGTGDTGISTADDRSALINKITDTLVQVEATYPKVNDSDVTNAGRGVDVLSYKFIIPGSVASVTATNIILTNYAMGAPLDNEPVGIVGNGFELIHSTGTPTTIFVNVRIT